MTWQEIENMAIQTAIYLIMFIPMYFSIFLGRKFRNKTDREFKDWISLIAVSLFAPVIPIFLSGAIAAIGIKNLISFSLACSCVILASALKDKDKPRDYYRL